MSVELLHNDKMNKEQIMQTFDLIMQTFGSLLAAPPPPSIPVCYKRFTASRKQIAF